MTSQEIISLVISLCPSVLSILTMVGVVVRTLHSFAKLKKEVSDMKYVEELKVQMSQLLRENYELKNTLNECMTKIDHVKRG